jgi:hypothetical protein
MDSREFKSRFEFEVRRLRLNMRRLPGLAAGGSGWEEKLLAHMRTLQPGCTWVDVLPGALIPEPPPEMLDEIAADDADPERYWRRAEMYEALMREMKRVLPAEFAAGTRQGGGPGMVLPNGPEHALRVFRELPDGAGAKVAWSALNATSTDS